MSRKRLLPGSIPTLNLPKKSFESEPSTSRRVLERHATDEEESTSTLTRPQSSIVYKNLDDFKKKVDKLKLVGWSRTSAENHYVLEHFDGKHALPVYSIRVDSGLGFSLSIFG